ncbi:MAG: MFS transporter, partial [Actinobacteria bacterium]|nr:MFS transporter [Actinomycetota bacterium]
MTTRGSSGSIISSQRPPFVLIVSITLTGIMANTLITPAIPDIRDAFNVGTSATGLLLAAATAPGIFLAPVLGLLADRFGRREVVVPCLVLFGLAGGLSSFAPSFAVLLALRLAQGIGSAGLINLAVTIIGDHWQGAERTRYIGLNAAALTASIFVLPPIGGVLAGIGGWRLTFAPMWIALVTATLMWRRLPRSARVAVTLRTQLSEARPYVGTARVLGAMVMAFVLFTMIFGLVLTVLPLYLADEFGVGAAGRGLMLAVPAVASTAAALNVGRIRHRVGASVTLAAAFFFFVVAFAVMAAVPALPAIVVALLLYGAGEGLSIPTLQDTVVSAAPMRNRGSLVALFVGVSRAGQTTGPVVGGVGLDAVGARVTFAVAAALVLPIVAAQGWWRRSSRGRGRRGVVAVSEAG